MQKSVRTCVGGSIVSIDWKDGWLVALLGGSAENPSEHIGLLGLDVALLGALPSADG